MEYIEKLKVAFQADGSFSSRKDKYTGERTGTVAIRFNLKKPRKKIRLKEILNKLPFKFSWVEYDNSHCSVRVCIPIEVFTDISKELRPMFSGDHIKKDTQWCRDFIEEIACWDGTIKKARPNNIGYTSVIEDNVTFVTEIAKKAGYSATFNSYKDIRNNYQRKTIYCTNINILGNKR